MKPLTPVALLFLPLMLFATGTVASQETAADLILTNTSIYTANPRQPFAESIAIKDGRIQAIGASADLEQWRGVQTRVLDLSGKQVLPGFIDNHNHVFEAASEAGGNCELAPGRLPEQQIPYLRACRDYVEPGQWLVGWGHTIDAILDEEARRTPLEVIDSVFPETPVIIMEQTSHSMWVNSLALEMAGITSASPDPKGGSILKDADSGQLLGILLDNAGDIVMEQAWNSLQNKFIQSYDGLLAGLAAAAEHGITTIGDGRLYWQRGWWEVWKAVEADQRLTARVSLRPWIYPHLPMARQLSFLRSAFQSNPDRLLLSNQVKMYSDGIVVNGSAKLLAPYQFSYLPNSPYGLNYIPEDAMSEWLLALNKIGYGAHIHAIGDGAVQESLNAIATARQSGSKQRYNMTHLELVALDDLPRFRELDVDADYQVGSDYIRRGDHAWAVPLLGKVRSRRLMPLGKVYQAGANVTLSSDWNVNPINPLTGIANAVKLAEKGLPSIQAAVDAYTINAARALGLEQTTGSLEIGKSADIVVLDRPILDATPQKVTEASAWMTLLRGKVVYQKY